MMSKYRLVFNGELDEGIDRSRCLTQLSRLFRQEPAALGARLFSGRRVVVKRTDDEALVARFMRAFEKAGAQLTVETTGLDAPASPPSRIATPGVHEGLDAMRTRKRPVVPARDDRQPSDTNDHLMTKKRQAVPEVDDRHKRRIVRRRRRGQ